MPRRNASRMPCILPCALIMSLLAPVTPAYADTESELADSRTQLEEKRGELDAVQADIDRLQGEIDAKAAEIANGQERHRIMASELFTLVRNNYKDMQGSSVSRSVESIMNSHSIDELMVKTQYAEAMTARMSSLTNNVRDINATLAQEYADISATKDAQEQLRAMLNEEIPQLESQIDELKDQLAAERASRVRPGNSGGSVAGTFATESTDGWRTGIASAYGGWSDPSTGAVCSTATGAVCDDWSMGVAVPMAWSDYRSYFNRTIEISYNGQSVIATVNDCGYMGAGSRSLDLQPGVFKAFGFTTCDAWGLRTVSYRFL